MKKKEGEGAALRVYLKEIRKYPLLTTDEEVDLGQKIENGDENARQRFIKANLPLVVSIAKKYVKKSLNLTLLGLIQEGNFGLLDAVRRFDWRIGRFATFATPRIIGSIKRALYGGRVIESLDIILPGGKEFCLYDLTEDKKAVCPDNGINQNMLRDILKGALARLNSRRQKIISMSFGLEDGIPYSQEEIAKVLLISIGEVCRLKADSIQMLRRNKKVNELK